jgi:hypothetical protein
VVQLPRIRWYERIYAQSNREASRGEGIQSSLAVPVLPSGGIGGSHLCSTDFPVASVVTFQVEVCI